MILKFSSVFGALESTYNLQRSSDMAESHKSNSIEENGISVFKGDTHSLIKDFSTGVSK